MATELTPRTKPETNLDTRSKPQVSTFFSEDFKPFEDDAPFQEDGYTTGTNLSPRTKP
jgi:hypothetical protein